jgi:hypothetical protein
MREVVGNRMSFPRVGKESADETCTCVVRTEGALAALAITAGLGNGGNKQLPA